MVRTNLFTILIVLLCCRMMQAIKWYRGSVIPGPLHSKDDLYGPYYSKTLNKIVIFQDRNVSLFDPYNCIFQELNIKSPISYSGWYGGQISSIDNKLYIDSNSYSSADKLLMFDLLTYSFKIINKVRMADWSCMIADELNNKLYIVGGGVLQLIIYWCDLTNNLNSYWCDESLPLTQIYSINDNTSYYDPYGNLTTARRNPSCIKYNDQLYIFGGHNKRYRPKYDRYDYSYYTTIESWNLNIIDDKSADYGWKLYTKNNLRLSSFYTNPLIFMGKIYLFNYQSQNIDEMIQIFDAIQGIIINDTLSSSSFDPDNKRAWNLMSPPINVNDELIYIFGGDDADTFQFGVVNDSILDKMDNRCFWSPTLSPTSLPTITPTIKLPTDSPSSTTISSTKTATKNNGLYEYNDDPLSDPRNWITLLVAILLLVLLIIGIVYVIKRLRKENEEKKNRRLRRNNNKKKKKKKKNNKNQTSGNIQDELHIAPSAPVDDDNLNENKTRRRNRAPLHIAPSPPNEAPSYHQVEMEDVDINNQIEGH